MWSWLGRTAFSCLPPLSSYARVNKDDGGDEVVGSECDPLLWSKDLAKHSHGEFSFAVVQANAVLEDHSQVETGRHATFVGVYDGHGGPEASRYISDHLSDHLLRLAQANGAMSQDILRSTFSETENGFLALVGGVYPSRPMIAAMGSCCLVGVIWRRNLYVANLGDSRVVIGYMDGSNKVVAEQLTKDHNVSIEEVRKELMNSHPEDSQIVVMKQGAWRIKGIIQVSRSIGDAYLKKPEFALNPSFPRFHLPEPLHKPVMRADPAIVTRDLQPNDQFLIFASDGLWEYLTNEEAVKTVHDNPREGIARRLILSALEKASEMKQVPYDEIKKLDPGIRRQVHDDITVVVIFIDLETLDSKFSPPALSVHGFVDAVGSSDFNFEDEVIHEA